MSVVVLAALLAPIPGIAEEHLVTSAAVRARLAEASSERAENIRTLEATLSSPAVVRAAGYVHADLDQLRAGVSYLNDQELRDLSARSKALTVDPAAGTNAVILVLAVIGAAAILLILIAIAGCSGGGCYD